MRNFDPRPSCTKCGRYDISLSHRDIHATVEAVLYGVIDFLKCKCNTCGFSWPMKAKDAKEETKCK